MKIQKNKKFINIEEIPFTPKLKSKLKVAFGDKSAQNAEEDSKKIKGFQFNYLSKNGKIAGLLALPKRSRGKVPCIIYNRGGYKDFGAFKAGALFKNLGSLASQGYLVIASQYSGNSFSDGKDEYGGSEVEDVIALYDVLKSLPNADLERIGMYGGSRGAITTFLILRKVKWIKAICIKSGIYDLIDLAKSRPEMKRVFKEAFGGSRKEIQKRSVVYWADKLSKKVPILMLHGSADWRIPATQALEASGEFLKHHIPHRLVLFEGADHFMSEVAEEEKSLTLAWFDKYVKKKAYLPNTKYHGK